MHSRILIADDDILVRDTVVKILTMFGHQVVAACSGRDVLAKVSEEFDAIILDINMPDLDGFETLEYLNAKKMDIPVLFLTGAGSMDYAVKAINLGAYDFLTKPIEDIELFNIKVKRAVEKRTFLRNESRYRQNLEEEVQRKTQELAEKNIILEKYSEHLEQSTVRIMSSLQTAMEEKDEYTAGHTRRVTQLAMHIGDAVDLSSEDLFVLRRAAQFHDIGKLVIDLSCIQKSGKLTTSEWELIKKHPEVGAKIVEPLQFMERESVIIRQHHERMDGKGYPDGIGGSDIHFLTRIITLADSFDAMTSRRNYRRNLSANKAVTELRNCAGRQFDPELVDVFSGIALSSAAFELQS
jgi:putative nucleotidyltransferase with HDIG domain